MYTRSNNQDQIADEENAGQLGTLPTEMLVEIAELLPSKDIQSLRHTCRFFGKHVLLKETMDKKTIHQVITMEEYTFWLFKNGKVFGSGSNYFNALGLGKEIGSCFNPTQIILPSNKPIARIAAGSDFTFYFDTEGDCYFCGSNTCGQLGNSGIIQYSFNTMRLPNGRPIVDVAVGHTNSFLRDDEGSWYGMGDNDSGKLGVNSRERYTGTPRQIFLPNGLPIAKVIPGQHDTFFQDIEDNWFHCGNPK